MKDSWKSHAQCKRKVPHHLKLKDTIVKLKKVKQYIVLKCRQRGVPVEGGPVS